MTGRLTEGALRLHFVSTDSTRDGIQNQSICAPRKGHTTKPAEQNIRQEHRYVIGGDL